jgi:hypothetical protein
MGELSGVVDDTGEEAWSRYEAGAGGVLSPFMQRFEPMLVKAGVPESV